MNVRRSVLVALALGGFALAPARGEISAVVDAFGTYVQTAVLPVPGAKYTKTWAVQRRKMGYFPLNAGGDVVGDRSPLIVENPLDRNRPYVVWGRSNGSDLDLVWSRWVDGGWTPVAPVGVPIASGNDIEPSVAFDTTGRAHMSWWREEGGKGRIYVSIFLETIWMGEFVVSDPRVDSRHPVITVLADRTIQVDYDTPHGRESRLVTVDWPVSINDDITPLGRITVASVGECRKH